jgi:hypothetical protein
MTWVERARLAVVSSDGEKAGAAVETVTVLK